MAEFGKSNRTDLVACLRSQDQTTDNEGATLIMITRTGCAGAIGTEYFAMEYGYSIQGWHRDRHWAASRAGWMLENQ